MKDRPKHHSIGKKEPGQSPVPSFIVKLILFLAVAMAAAGVIAQNLGREDLAKTVFGPCFAILVGTFFAGAMVVNAVSGKKAWVIYFGWISLKDRPLPYLAVLSIPLLMGLGAIATGIWGLLHGWQ